jgi:hypothetical protein
MVSIWTVLFIQLGIILLAVIAFILRNYYIKNKKLTTIVEQQDVYIREVYNAIKYSEEKIKEIDSRQIFQSDDEVGFFFTNLKKLQELLSEYIKNVKI